MGRQDAWHDESLNSACFFKSARQASSLVCGLLANNVFVSVGFVRCSPDFCSFTHPLCFFFFLFRTYKGTIYVVEMFVRRQEQVSIHYTQPPAVLGHFDYVLASALIRRLV